MALFAKDPEKELERLRRACDERDEKYIDKCLKRGKESLIRTVKVLGEEQMDSYMPRIIELLSSPDADKRKAAAYALGEMRYSSAVTFLVKRLEEEEDPGVAEEIRGAIAKYRGGGGLKLTELYFGQSINRNVYTVLLSKSA